MILRRKSLQKSVDFYSKFLGLKALC
ncbi:hypothetical protein [Agaribacterium sp. ZY112]